MKYYKLINNNSIIGAVTSDNFIYYSPVVDCFLRGSEVDGEYICFQNKLYRDTWMNPIVVAENYTNVQVNEISEQEYNIYMDAIYTNTAIEEIIDETEEEEQIPIDPIYQDSLDFIRSAKINEMSYACKTTIESGFDFIIRGETHHFSLTTQDQFNLINLSTLAQTQDLIPYHADGEEAMYFTADEINQLVNEATRFKIYHTTYYNSLKTYINALETIEDVSEITYGVTIPIEYQSDVYKEISMEAL